MKDLNTPSPTPNTPTGRGDGACPAVLIPKRRRGAPAGNRNRWKHGRYSRAAIEKRAALKTRVAEIIIRCDHAIAYAFALARGQSDYAAALLSDAEALAQLPVTRNRRAVRNDADVPKISSSVRGTEEMVPEEDPNL
jgi:hypothetical protein